MKNLLYLTLMGFLFSGCAMTHGDYIKTEYTRLRNDPCKVPSGQMYLFFEGENIDFEYTRLGHVEAIGDRYADNQEILDHLKYKARENCANGVINIQKGLRDRTEGVGLSDEHDKPYDAHTFQGVAVQIDADSLFLEKYGRQTDTTYIQQVKTTLDKERKQAGTQVVVSVLTGIGAVVLGIMAATGSL